MGAEVTCCLCGGAFDERALAGSWLDRRCPLCGGRLSEDAYDRAAAELAARHRPRPGKRAAGELRELALARYYTSEWFRLACAGQGSEAADRGLFGLRPGYDASGAFTLVPADADRSPEGGLGVSAEYFVFDAIRSEIAREGSPLSGSFLVPHLVFPWLPGQKPKQWGAKQRAEVDCVLMCPSCAVVVEVKRRSHHVRVSRDFQHVRERTEGGSFRSGSETVGQVARGADSFAERQQVYPPDRVCKAIVFVDPLSFECPRDSFEDGWFAGTLGGGADRLVSALGELAAGSRAVAGAGELRRLSARLLSEFGNTRARRQGGIVDVGGAGRAGRRSSAFLGALGRRTRDGSSALAGARLLRDLSCEVEVSRRGKDAKLKQVGVAGLLLTRSHAVLVDTRRWPVHVNTHAPFATVYTGDPAEGAECVEADIRHDWDLDGIRYRNRSGSLTLLTYVSKSLTELDRYRERNRLCTLHVFLDPASFVSDCDEFRQRTYLGFWRGREDNVMAALERLEASAEPIMSQAELDRLADGISGP